MATWRVLLIDSDEEEANLTRQMLADARRDRFLLEWSPSAETGLAALRAAPFDAALVGCQVGAEKGPDLIRRCLAAGYLGPLILLTGRASSAIDQEAIQAGAVDSLSRQDLSPALLERAIRSAIQLKRAEADLRQSESIQVRERERLQRLFDRIPVMVVAYRNELQIVQFNKTFEDLTGWTTADAHDPGLDLLAELYPDPADRVAVAEFMARPEGGWREFVLTTRRGELFHVRWAIMRLTDSLQIAIGVDIRDQVKAEQALRASEERFRLASQAVAGIVYDWDLVTGEVQRTDEFKQVTGFRLEDVPEDPTWWTEHIHPDDRARVLAEIQAALDGPNDRYTVEYRIRHADGNWVHIWDRGHIIRAADGRAARVVGTATDITARKELELALAQANSGLMAANRELALANLALRESEGRFRIALQNAPVTVFTQDCDLRFTWIYNPFRGLTIDQILGRRDDEILPTAAAGQLMEVKRDVLASGKQAQLEMTAEVNGQKIVYLLTLEPLIYAGGEVTGLRGAGVDLTELRRLEAEFLERSAQLELHHRLFEQREMERQRIARDLHDGPIQDLLGMLFTIHAAQEPASATAGLGELAQRQEAALQAVREEIQRLVGDLRVLCNELRPPALVQLGLEQALRSHAEALQMQHAALTIHLDLPRSGRPLPDHLRLALFRIYQEGINNILRHSNAREVFIRLAVSEDEVALEIIDDGEGFTLPADWLELAREGHLGLVGIKERAEAVGGVFSITARPGQGTRVRVTVPIS